MRRCLPLSVLDLATGRVTEARIKQPSGVLIARRIDT
jgi:hypothetical protein